MRLNGFCIIDVMGIVNFVSDLAVEDQCVSKWGAMGLLCG